MEAFTDEILAVKVEELKDIEDFLEECEICKKPNLIHAGACTRSQILDGDELKDIWREFRIQMKKVMKIVRMNSEKKLKEEETMMG